MWLWLAPILCAAAGLSMFLCTMLVEWYWHRKHQKRLAEHAEHHDELNKQRGVSMLAKEEVVAETRGVPLPPMEEEEREWPLEVSPIVESAAPPKPMEASVIAASPCCCKRLEGLV
eukprot:363813-Rhodomonas_salina.2